MSSLLDLELNEPPGATAFEDSSGYGNDAAQVGAVSANANGHAGKGVLFGSGGVLQVVNPSGVPDSPQIAVEAWISPNDLSPSTQVILARAGASAGSIAYELRLVNNTKAEFRVTGASAPGVLCTTPPLDGSIAVNGWFHVAGWYDGLAVSVAVNGMRVSASCGSGGVLGSGPIIVGGGLFVGGLLTAGNVINEPFKGTIDEVRVRPVAAQSYVAGGRVTCPAGFTLIGTPGSRMAFCISSNKEPGPGNYALALQGCYNKAEHAQICTTQQWGTACISGAVAPPGTMGGTYEFTADQGASSYSACYSSCDLQNSGTVCGASWAYRCCLQ